MKFLIKQSLIVLFLGLPLLTMPRAVAQVSGEIENLIDNSVASNAIWSVQVRDMSGNILEDLNGNKLMRPASNFKLVSSGAFLDKLGPDFQFQTKLYGRGNQTGEVWDGDLIVKGGGDPTINGDFYNDNAFYVFEKWVQVLQKRGIKKIDGNLVGFDGLFDDIPYPKGWEWDDLSFYYAPEINALSFNSNVVDLEVTANGRVGSIPQISWFPFDTPYVEFVNEQVITPRGTSFKESYMRLQGTNVIFLRSTLPQSYYETEPLTITAPAFYFMDTFKRYLENRGVEVTGQLYIDSDFYGWRNSGLDVLDTHESVPLHQIVEKMNMDSNNFYAEMLLKKIAAEEYSVQGSTDLGLQVLKEFMDQNGFDTQHVTLRDASGMAPAILLRGDDLNKYLVQLSAKEYFPYFFDSLPVGGKTGTLSHRFRNSPVSQKFYGKTGFVSGVRSLSGYLDVKSGNRLAVTMLTNNYAVRTTNVDIVHERILEFLYENY